MLTSLPRYTARFPAALLENEGVFSSHYDLGTLTKDIAERIKPFFQYVAVLFLLAGITDEYSQGMPYTWAVNRSDKSKQPTSY